MQGTAPTPPVAPVAPVISITPGQGITISPPPGGATPQAIYEGFKNQRRELANQLESLDDTRRDLANRLQEEPAISAAEKTGVESRLAEIYARISAVDKAIADGLVSRQLPNVRREGVRLLAATYPSHDTAAAEIDRGLRGFYASRGDIDQAAVGRAGATLQNLYRQNVFPTMSVTWGSYPNNRGHVTSNGCFRCHDSSHEAKDGSTIPGDCETCHKQIERPAS